MGLGSLGPDVYLPQLGIPARQLQILALRRRSDPPHPTHWAPWRCTWLKEASAQHYVDDPASGSRQGGIAARCRSCLSELSTGIASRSSSCTLRIAYRDDGTPCRTLCPVLSARSDRNVSQGLVHLDAHSPHIPPQPTIAVIRPTCSSNHYPPPAVPELTPPRRSEKNAGQVQIKRFFFSVEGA